MAPPYLSACLPLRPYDRLRRRKPPSRSGEICVLCHNSAKPRRHVGAIAVRGRWHDWAGAQRMRRSFVHVT